MTDDTARTRLRRKIDQNLDDAQVVRVENYVDELTRPLNEWVNESSELITESWLQEFRSRFQAHHAVNDYPLTKTTFENAFELACRASGRKTLASTSATNRFWDLRVDGLSYSLKTTAAKNLSKRTVHISKLTEIAWLQDQRSAIGRRDRTRELFAEFRDAVDSIIMLRAFKTSTHLVQEYELIEIPGSLFDPIFQAPKEAFSADGPTVPLPYGSSSPDLQIKLDRSDSKMTIAKIQVTSCIVHACWEFLRA